MFYLGMVGIRLNREDGWNRRHRPLPRQEIKGISRDHSSWRTRDHEICKI